jgi:multidrug efflux pump subunit AcrA (membrane-fusion protein)
MKIIFLPSILTLILVAAAHASVAVPPVILTEQGIKNLGLETVALEESDFEITTFALGRTEAIPESRSVLSSRVPGRVIENNLKIGKYVEKDASLVLLESRQPGDPPPSIWLKAPAAGTVISVNTRLGAPLEPSDRLAEIADLQTIYLIVTMPQATAGKIKQGTQAKVRFPLRPDREYTATLLKFATPVCPDAVCAMGQDTSMRSTASESADINSTSVIFTIENTDGQLRPDMNAECFVIMEKRQNVLSVPREALQGAAANRHVYVKHMTIPNAFDRVHVQTGLTGNGRVEIVDGLLPGDEVVTRGSYSLGFAGSSGGPSLKEAMDAAHGHEHNEDGSEKSEGQPVHAADEHEEHSHESHGISTREMFFMVSTAILALLLIVTSFRHRSSATASHELS